MGKFKVRYTEVKAREQNTEESVNGAQCQVKIYDIKVNGKSYIMGKRVHYLRQV